MRLSVLVEGAHGLTWDRWKDFVVKVEEMGYAGLYGSDHFTLNAAPPDSDSLELIVSLAYAADHTGSRISETGPGLSRDWRPPSSRESSAQNRHHSHNTPRPIG